MGDSTKIAYEYDEFGNIKNETLSGLDSTVIANTSYIYNALNRLVQVVKEEPLKISSLTVTPSEVFALPDKPITFSLSGIICDGIEISDEVLNEAAWTVDSSCMTLSSVKGKNITGIVSRASWDNMLSTEVITVRAALQNKVVEAKIHKIGIRELILSPVSVFALPDQEVTFTLAGILDDGTYADYDLLSAVNWTAYEAFMEFNTLPIYSGQEGRDSISITGVIPSINWNRMKPGTCITVSVDLYGKKDNAKVYRGGIGDPELTYLEITPCVDRYTDGWSQTFTLSGLMTDGTVAPDSILNTAVWSTDNKFSLSNSTGKTVGINYIGKSSSTTGSNVMSEEDNVLSLLPPITLPTDYDIEVSIGQIIVGLSLEYYSTSIPGVPENPPGIPIDPPINPPVEEFSTTLPSYEKKAITYNEFNFVNSLEGENNNQIVASLTDKSTIFYTYDNDGNMIEEREVKATGEKVSTYRYNDFNQLIEVANPQGITTFTYYPTELRESKIHGSDVTKYYYDGQNVILEEVNNIQISRNIFGATGPVIRENIDAAGNMNSYYYVYNGHGDVTALIDENVNIICDYEYDIYGEALYPDEITIDNPFRYSGQYFDKETGLYYLRARYYDPGLMRFISEDNYNGDVKDPLSLNLYAYCVGNPIALIDIDGHAPQGTWALNREGTFIGTGGVLLLYTLYNWLAQASPYIQYSSQNVGNLTNAANAVKDKVGDNSNYNVPHRLGNAGFQKPLVPDTYIDILPL